MSGILPCGPSWEGAGGARGMFGLSRLANFSSTRVIVWGSVHASIRLARRTNCSVDCMLGYDADMMTVEYCRGFQ